MTKLVNNYGRMLQRTERKEFNNNFFNLVSIRYTNPNLEFTINNLYWMDVNHKLTESLLRSFITNHTTLILKTFQYTFVRKNEKIRMVATVKVKSDEHNHGTIQVGFELPPLFSATPWFDPNFVRPGLGYWRMFHRNKHAVGVHHFYAALKLAFGRWMPKESLDQFEKEFPLLSK
tara:strand:+ start:5952 stop:6476 length:525 start_codon:yes stop_codon:yes gene_type:complete